jgi:transcriptional regulator with XRE-family HTH domain
MVDMPSTAGDIVREERQRRGWSLRRAADAAGTTHAHWDRIERNEARRAAEWRRLVCTAFDWPDDWVENPPAPPEVTRRDDEVLQAFAQLGETMLAAMESMQRQIAELQSTVDQLAAEARPTRPGSRRKP